MINQSNNYFSNLQTLGASFLTGLVVLVSAMFLVVLPSGVWAQAPAQTTTAPDTTKPTEGDAGGFVPCGNTASNPCQVGHLFSAFVVIVNYLIAMAAFVAVVAIVFAGFMMVYSQGQEALKAAKGRLSGAVIGLVLIAAAFILINALFAGSLSIGVRDGASILSSPLEYIKKGDPPSNTGNSTPNSGTNTNTNTPPKPKK